jgi:hypothetical protein
MTTTDLAPVTTALNAAWNPLPTPAHRVGGEGDDLDFWNEQCGCGGEDDSGRTICTCADSCCCDQCRHYTHVVTRRCAVADCTAPSAVQVRAWSVSHHRVQAHRLDPDLTPETGGGEWVDADDTPSYGWSQTACSHRHARQLIEADQSSDWRQRAEAGKDLANRLRYEIGPWRYEPDRLDVGEILDDLRAAGRAAAFATAELAQAGYDPTATHVLAAEVSLEDARRAVARLADMLATISTHAPEPRRFMAGDPEPSGLRTVRLGDDYYHRGDRAESPGTTVWIGPTVAQRYTWDQLTSSGELIEVGRHHLVLPTATPDTV